MKSKPFEGEIVVADGELCIFARVSRNRHVFISLNTGNRLDSAAIDHWVSFDGTPFTDECNPYWHHGTMRSTTRRQAMKFRHNPGVCYAFEASE
jgi:hypothetical protein